MSHRIATAVAGAVLGAAQLVAVAAGPVAADPGDDPAGVAGEPSASLEVTGPDSAEVGEIIDFTVMTGDAAAVEAVIEYDKNALDFGGLYGSSDASLLMVTNQPNRVAVAAYQCRDQTCESGLAGPIGAITVRFAVVEPGLHVVRVDRGLMVSDAGAVHDVEPTELTLSVAEQSDGAESAGNDNVDSSAEPTPPLRGQRQPIDGGGADVTGDGVVTGSDVTELALAWDEVRRRGQPCELEAGRLTAVDVDGSGCIDVADLAAVAGQASPINAGATKGRPDNGADDQGDAGAVAEAVEPIPMVVNSTSDEWDANLNNGICNTPSGVCSLRAAILQANANSGPDVIHFNIPGPGPHRISLSDQLPTVNDSTGPLVIDGYTQPGARANTDELISNASIRIEIRGGGYDGRSSLVISSPNNTVRGLAIYRTFSNVRLTGTLATGNRIVGNFIGTNATGRYEVPGSQNENIDQSGVEIGNGASANLIGTPALADRNVISGNPYSGVRINHANTRGNIVQNNLVGPTPTGDDSLYTYVAGIDVQWGANETIVGGYQDHAGNVVTGNSNYGIDLSHSSKNNRIVGNYLGTDATGSRVRNHTGNLIGLAIKDNTVGNLIEHNVIGGNTRDGIWHRHNFTGGNTFRSNRIGVGVDGSAIGNARYGMFLSGHDDVYEHNIFANSGSTGVYISSYNGGNGFSPPEYTQRNRLSANSFYGNGSSSIRISGAHNNISSPRITSAQTGLISGTACRNCRVELYVINNGARQFVSATTASSGGAWSISDSAIRDNTFSALAISTNNDTSQLVSTTTVGRRPSNTAPTIGAIADQSGVRYGYVEFAVSAGDENGNHLTFSALGLPAGVSIDQRSGVISGRPGSVGRHTVRVRVDDGATATQRSFVWSIDVPNQAPTVDPVADQSDQAGDAVSLTVTGSDPDGDAVAFSATGLPDGLSISTGGLISGIPSRAGSFNVTATVTDGRGGRASTSFSWTISAAPAAFSCQVSGSVLSWTDDGASRYFIRQLRDGVDRYLGSSTGLSYQLGRAAGTYTVRHWRGGTPVDATCEAPAQGGFSCQVNGSTLSWTDDGASRYFIRQNLNGVDGYVGSSVGTTFQLNNPAGTYTVRHWQGPIPIDATCDA